jgi:dinuclear metal center YbgI/SA1388 family protein
MASLHELVDYTNQYLRIAEIGDWDNALNGLQIENSGKITKLGAAVDASTRVFNEAVEKKINLLLVHHGLFWPGLQPVRGPLQRQLRTAFANDLALYSAHLPLDLHPEVGNNAQLARALAIDASEPFFEEKGSLIGLRGASLISRDELRTRLGKVLGHDVKLFGHGPERTENIAIITGGAGGEIYRVAAEGIDTFITGEAPHWAAVAAAELGINLLLGGHYATETFGVKALAAHLSEKFQLAFEFIDSPTGL